MRVSLKLFLMSAVVAMVLAAPGFSSLPVPGGASAIADVLPPAPPPVPPPVPLPTEPGGKTKTNTKNRNSAIAKCKKKYKKNAKKRASCIKKAKRKNR